MAHIFLRDLIPDNGIFDSAESFVSFFKTLSGKETPNEMRLIDSLRFMASSINQPSENLAKYECKTNRNYLRNNLKYTSDAF